VRCDILSRLGVHQNVSKGLSFDESTEVQKFSSNLIHRVLFPFERLPRKFRIQAAKVEHPAIDEKRQARPGVCFDNEYVLVAGCTRGGRRRLIAEAIASVDVRYQFITELPK
jgi:hypothetical protein